MSIHTWWLFVVAAFFVSGTPGPNMLHVMSRVVELGFRKTVLAMLGCLTSVLIIQSASALGLTAVLLAVPGIFEVLRYTGAAYLIYLGIKSWRSDVTDDATGDISPSVPDSPARIYRKGFLVGISNPKALLFAAAFLPQFVNPAAPPISQYLILIVTFAIVESAWYVVYALGGRSLSSYLARPTIKRRFNRIAGGIFIGFGVALLKAKPAR